jgi:hypothetical protein
METDDGGDTAGLETLVQHAPQRDFKLFEFVIDGDPQGLKDLRCRMTASRRSPASIGRAVADCRGQVESGSNRVCSPPFDDISSDTATVSFFAEALQEFAEFAFVEPGDKISRTFPLRSVESQVEWAIRRKAESSRSIGELI